MEFFKDKFSEVFETIFESVSEGIIVVNTNQKIATVNGAAAEMFGYEHNELVGLPLDTLIPKDYRKQHKGHVSKFMEHSDKRKMGKGRDLYGARKDGTSFPVEAGLNPFMVEGRRYVMAIVTDITDRKNYTENLERTVRERTSQLTEALEKEKDLNELKTKFLSLVSHEFKTPLSGILTSATLIGKYTETVQQQKREKHLRTIQNKVKYLNNIINDFLSIERLESGKVNYKFSSFPLSKVINEVIYDANTHLKEGQKILYPEQIDAIEIDFDEKILVLVLTNLVNNAVKYSPEHTEVAVKVIPRDKELDIAVIDQGIGIPNEEQKFIFNRYFRAANVLTNQGTGIGLNIVKSHLQNLGGSITFSSEEGKGSIFTITIPTP
ncbi:PAS domain-containing sensor histidine kinase [Aureisphaera galaxeae]|nr:PAS domain-containing sensor histidine kinase [Aureisphaera galaxeae]MDC8003772.1 PAS domain-containing sensor histidine kinase [Aureisphaera galaxeae]